MPYSNKNSIPFIGIEEELDANVTRRPQSRVADNIDITSQALISGVGRDFRISSGTPTWIFQKNIVNGDSHKTALDKLDLAIGARDIYTPGRYLTSGQSLTASLDALQIGLLGVDGGADYVSNIGQKMGCDPTTVLSALDPFYITPYYSFTPGILTLESGIGKIDTYVGKTQYVENSYVVDEDGIGVALDKLEGATQNRYTVGDGKKSHGKFNSILDAFNAAALTKGTVFIKRGRYTLPSQIVVPEDVHIDGEGYGTEIYFNASSSNSLSVGAFLLMGRNQVSNFYLQRGGIRYEELDPFSSISSIRNYDIASFDIDSDGYFHCLFVNWFVSPVMLMYDVYERTPEGFVRLANRRKTWTDSGLTAAGACQVRVGYNNRAVIALTTIGGTGTGADKSWNTPTTLKYNIQARDGNWGNWTTISTDVEPKYNADDSDHGFFLYVYKKRPTNYTNPNGRFYIVYRNHSTATLRLASYDSAGILTIAAAGTTGPGDYGHRSDKEVWMDVNEDTHEIHIFRPQHEADGLGGRVYYTRGFFNQNNTYISQGTSAGLFYFGFASVCGALDKRSGNNTLFIVGTTNSIDSPPGSLAVMYKRPNDTDFQGPYRYTGTGADVQEKSCVVDNNGRLHIAYNNENKRIYWMVFDPIDNTFQNVHIDGDGTNFRYPEMQCTAEGSIVIMWLDRGKQRMRMISSAPAFSFEGNGHLIKNVHLNNADLILPKGSKATGVLMTYKGK